MSSRVQLGALMVLAIAAVAVSIFIGEPFGFLLLVVSVIIVAVVFFRLAKNRQW